MSGIKERFPGPRQPLRPGAKQEKDRVYSHRRFRGPRRPNKEEKARARHKRIKAFSERFPIDQFNRALGHMQGGNATLVEARFVEKHAGQFGVDVSSLMPSIRQRMRQSED